MVSEFVCQYITIVVSSIFLGLSLNKATFGMVNSKILNDYHGVIEILYCFSIMI